MKKETIYRGLIYALGMLILAIGLSLNTQIMLGVSPILSTAFTIYSLTNMTFGDATLIIYIILIVMEIIIHIIDKKNLRVILFDMLQLPLSLVFTRFLNIFKAIIPNFETDLTGSFAGTIPGRLIFLSIAIICTGLGIVLSLNMRLIPNPGDGIVQALADHFHKQVGFIKNCIDITCVTISVLMGLFIGHTIYGIGIGTVCAMVFVGRSVSVGNHFLKNRILKIANLDC